MNNQIKLGGIFEKGYGFIAKFVMLDNNLTLQEKGVYAYLCSYTGKGTDVFPTRKKICEDLNISNDSLGKYLNNLKNAGYIDIKQDDSTTKFGRNIYTINLNLPCRKISVSENLDTNNNNIYNNNSIINIKENNNTNVLLKEKPKKPIFSPPTLEEIREYCKQRGNNVDAKRFFDYYEVNDWKDSNGKQIKNWKQKMIANWEGKSESQVVKEKDPYEYYRGVNRE